MRVLIVLWLLKWIIPTTSPTHLDKEPFPIVQPLPVFPKKAVKTSVVKKVVVRTLLEMDGSVMKAVVGESSGDTVIDRAAVEAAKFWEYSPAIQRSRPVRIWISTPVYFKPSGAVTLRASDLSGSISAKLSRVIKGILRQESQPCLTP